MLIFLLELKHIAFAGFHEGLSEWGYPVLGNQLSILRPSSISYFKPFLPVKLLARHLVFVFGTGVPGNSPPGAKSLGISLPEAKSLGISPSLRAPV